MASFENRKYLRADIALKATYRTIPFPVIEGAAYSRDISVIGISLIMPDILIKDTQLEMQIYLGEDAKPITARGRVLWQKKCDYQPQSNRPYYICGIQFEDMAVEDAVRASEFVRGYLLRESEEGIRKIIEMNEKLKLSSS